MHNRGMNKEQRTQAEITLKAFHHPGDIIVTKNGMYVLFLAYDDYRVEGQRITSERATNLIDSGTVDWFSLDNHLSA